MNTPIVVLHGWGLSKKVYEPLVEELRRNHYSVFAPDFPGFGSLAPPKRAFKLDDFVDFLKKFLSTHNVQKPILIGHSFGGRVSLKFQERYPTSVTALILTGTPGYTPVKRWKLKLYISLAKVGALLFSLPFLNKAKDRVRLAAYYLAGARDFYRAQGVMRQTFKNIVQEPLEKSMKAVRVPTLLIWGDNDSIVPVYVAKRMKKTIPHADLTILPNQDHRVPFKEPKLFTTSVLKWLENL